MSSLLATATCLCLLLALTLSSAYPLDQGSSGGAEEAKRGFDPIEVASNFGSFGKRYRSNGPQSRRFNYIMNGMLDQLRGVEPRAPFVQTAKRQFDPIGYGVYGRFG